MTTLRAQLKARRAAAERDTLPEPHQEYEAPRDPRETLRVRGVGRVADEPRALLIALTERPTDDEVRSLHDYLRSWRLR